jgi:hypothetical protein
MFNGYNILGFCGAAVVGWMVATGFSPTTGTGERVPESVRANPGSYRPVYIPTYRGSGGGSGGGWSSGK